MFLTCSRQKSPKRRGGLRRATIKVTLFFTPHRPLFCLEMCQFHSLLCLCLLSALRPPVPPDFCPAFSSIVRLLCCDIFVHVLRRVLQRVTEEQTTHWTEAMIQRVGITSVDAVNFTWPLVFIAQTTCCNKWCIYCAGPALDWSGIAWRESTTWGQNCGGSELWFQPQGLQ